MDHPAASEGSGRAAPTAAVRVPYWAMAIVLASLLAAVADMPSFFSTLGDAVVFTRVGQSLDRGAPSPGAVASLRQLAEKFPASTQIEIRLLAAQLSSGDLAAAQSTLDQLRAKKLSNSDINTINAWVAKANAATSAGKLPAK